MSTAIATTEKASGFKEIGVEVQQPGAGQVLVETKFAGINYIDKGQATTGAYVEKFPYFLGKEWSGTVKEVGENVGDLSAGDKVMGVGYLQSAAGFRQLLTAERVHVAKLPSNVELEAAAGIPHTFATGHWTLFSKEGLGLSISPNSSEKETSIIVWGASTAVGYYAIQQLTYFGYSNILAVASAKHTETLTKLGTKQVFDRSDANLVVDVQKALSENTPHAVVYQADQQGYTNLAKVLKSGSKLRFIIREQASEGTFASGVDVKRITVFGMVQDHEIGDKILSKHAQDMLAASKLNAKPHKIVEAKNSFVETLNAAYELLMGGSSEKLVVEVAKP